MLQRIIKEDLLHYVWKTKQIDLSGLQTTEGLEVMILDFGVHNHDSGPDFFNGKVIIGDTQWAGNIEMHVFSSDWEKHSHDSDPAYDSVILHVVYEEDKPAYTTREAKIPCIELKSRISKSLKLNYAKLLQNNQPISCSQSIGKVDNITIGIWKDRLVAERLETKANRLKNLLDETGYDWDETMYRTTAKYMGSKVNVSAFESLAKNITLNTIMKNKGNQLAIEALLFGTAGMLEANYKDQYFTHLKKEFSFLKSKYKISSIPPVMWKFSRMRPANFPTVRIAQFAEILRIKPRLFSEIVEVKNNEDLRKLFQVSASKYWDNHYRFDKESVNRKKRLTPGFIDLLLINVVAPMVYLYGLEKSNSKYTEQAIEVLTNIKAEKNTIISKWNDLGTISKSAMDSQALLHLFSMYCTNKRCLSCSIGNKIVKG